MASGNWKNVLKVYFCLRTLASAFVNSIDIYYEVISSGMDLLQSTNNYLGENVSPG